MRKVVKDSARSLKRNFELSYPKNIPQGILNNIQSSPRDQEYEDVQAQRYRYLSPSLSTFQAFKKPFYPRASFMQYMWDYSGKQYLDCLAQNLTISVGHNHPQVVQAAKEQMDRMTHCTTMYHNDAPIRAAEKIVERCLPNLDKEFEVFEVKDGNVHSETYSSDHENHNNEWVVHFVNSGSEAIDLALMMARAYTNHWDILALRNSYHGLHSTAMAATGMSVCKQNIPHSFGIQHVMNPDMFRGPFSDCGLSHEEQVDKYVDDIKKTIDYETDGSPAAFLFEQVQGYGGIHILPEGYVAKASELVRERGGLIIADEVQSGFGRMGDDTFWSFEIDKQNKIYPDMIVTAKGLGNGFPIAAVMVRREIAESITSKQFFNTYGGNPLVCSASSAVLDILTSQEHKDHVNQVGKKLNGVLQNLKEKYPRLVGDVRGRGLMYGVEITKDGSTEPDKENAIEVFEEARDQGLIMGKGGFYGNVLRIMPPMCISLEDVDFIENVLGHSLEKFHK